MSIKPQYENVRYTSAVFCVSGQSLVECRISNEGIDKILAVHTYTVPTDYLPEDGGIRYSGKLYFTVIYEDADKKICRVERGVEYSYRVEEKKITPSMSVIPDFSVVSVNKRREGTGIYFSALVVAKFEVMSLSEIESVVAGDGLVVKTEPKKICKVAVFSADGATGDEFETDYASDILMHTEQPVVSGVRLEDGLATVTGDVILNICAVKDGKLSTAERSVPFKIEIPYDETAGESHAKAVVKLKETTLSAVANEMKDKCLITVDISLHADVRIYTEAETSVGTDAYSTECKTELFFEEKTVKRLLASERILKHIEGEASLGEAIESAFVPECTLCQKAEMSLKKTAKGYEAEGAVFATLIVIEESGRKSVPITFPFAFPVEIKCGDETETNVSVCELKVRKEDAGKIRAEATLRLQADVYEDKSVSYLSSVKEGEIIKCDGCALSVYLTKPGDGLWDTAKRLNKTPEELKRSNPELNFPLEKEERILVYRQKR